MLYEKAIKMSGHNKVVYRSEREAGDDESDARRPRVSKQPVAGVPRSAVDKRQAPAQQGLYGHCLENYETHLIHFLVCMMNIDA